MALEEVYATNSSFKNNLIQANSKGVMAENSRLREELLHAKQLLGALARSRPRVDVGKLTQKYTKRLVSVEMKAERLKRMMEQQRLKESMNLMEISLGDEVMDAQQKQMAAKIRHVKEDLEIEQKNNVNLRTKIVEKEQRIVELEKKLEEALGVDKQQVTDEDLIVRNQELDAKVKELEKKKADVDVQIGQIKERYKKSYKKMKKMEEEMEDVEKNMEALSQTVENQRKELREKDEEIEKVKKEKGTGASGEKSPEDYQRDLATGNKENERLNLLLEEERGKVEALQMRVLQLTEEVRVARRGEENSKIKLNLKSQTLQKEDRQQLLDAVTEDPQVAEFGLQGGIKSISFKNIFKDLKHKYTKSKTTTELDRKEVTQPVEPVKAIEGEPKDKMPEQMPLQPILAVINEPEQVKTERENKMTININNINITHYSLISPTSKKGEKKEPRSLNNSREIKSLESNQVSPHKVDFKSKLSNSFDLKSLDNQREYRADAFKSNVSEKKSSIDKMYLPEDMTDSDSSITSLIQNASPRNSKGDLRNDKPRLAAPNESQNMIRNMETVKKTYNGSSGNMIIKNSRVSVNSVNENMSCSPKNKMMHKSLFALKIDGKSKELQTMDNVETLAKGDSSFNFEDDSPKDNFEKSESFDEDILGFKKEMESGVFSKREINAFEEDENIDLMMADDEVEPGTTVMEFSQRLIAKTKEGAMKNNNNAKPKAKPAEKAPEINLTPPQKKNLFDESFKNDSFAFASNPREQSLLMPPAQILNTNHSFAGDKLGFVSGTSFGTNNEINLVLDSIKEHSEREEQKRKEQRRPSASNLKTVPEEGAILDQFEFKLPKKMMHSPRGSQFDSKNSLSELGDFMMKHRERNPDYKDANMLDIMKAMNTDGIDQSVYDNIFNTKKVKDIEIDGNISPSMQSPSGSTDGMFFGTKRIEEDSKND